MSGFLYGFKQHRTQKEDMGIVYDAHFMYGRAYDPNRVYNDIREQLL